MEDAPISHEQETVAKTKFNSPIPFFIGVKNKIYGTQKPATAHLIVFYINKSIAYLFLIWHLLSYFTIVFRNEIYTIKRVDVETLILQRGLELDIPPHLFLDRLIDHHLWSIGAWLAVHLACIVVWRGRKWGIYMALAAALVYATSTYFLLGWTYIMEDISYLDRAIYLLFMVLNTLLFLFFSGNGSTGPNYLEEEQSESAPLL